MENDGRFVTTSEAARMLGMSHNHVLKTARHALHERGGPGRPNYYWRYKIVAMDRARRRNMCTICGDQPAKSAGHATCGHPRCVAQHRVTYKPNPKARPPAKKPQELIKPPLTETERIAQTWRELATIPHESRAIITAHRHRVNIATVMGVIARAR
jgi:hypothetical protein